MNNIKKGTSSQERKGTKIFQQTLFLLHALC